MIFNEIYSAYYNTVAKILSAVLEGDTDVGSLNKIISENAFGESMLTVLPALKSEKWKLVKEDMTTPLQHKPVMPLTLIQKRWLKAISLDPRIKLFDVDFSALDDVEPLFTADDYYIYDKYSDGDDFEDENYIEHFRTILSALKNGQNLIIEMLNRRGKKFISWCMPKRLEYSEKDDKFRLVAIGFKYFETINLSRIVKCRIYNNEPFVCDFTEPENRWLTLKVKDERNTLERCLMHFAHFEKRAEKADDYYLLHIKYNPTDEREMAIRVLSFGPTVEVSEPESFREFIIQKLKNQKSCELV